MQTDWLYALECIVAPCALGTAVYGLFALWNGLRRRSDPTGGGLPPVDYLI